MAVLVVVGPPAVGKSTVTRLLANALTPSIRVDVDYIRDGMVVNGAVLPHETWSAALVEQLAAARASACGIARAYSAIGFDVVIDDFYDPHSRLEEYAAIDDLRPRRVILVPERAVAQERSRARDDAAAAFIAAGIDEVYALLPSAEALAADGWAVLDTSDLTAEQTRDVLLGST